MFTARHYWWFAELIAAHPDQFSREAAGLIADGFAAESPNFRRELFMDKAGYPLVERA